MNIPISAGQKYTATTKNKIAIFGIKLSLLILGHRFLLKSYGPHFYTIISVFWTSSFNQKHSEIMGNFLAIFHTERKFPPYNPALTFTMLNCIIHYEGWSGFPSTIELQGRSWNRTFCKICHLMFPEIETFIQHQIMPWLDSLAPLLLLTHVWTSCGMPCLCHESLQIASITLHCSHERCLQQGMYF